MNNREALGSWIRRFLMEYLVGERNLARNTQQSYRDAIRLLVVFTAAKAHKKVDELLIPDIDADLLRAFLRHIEEKRKCSVSSRNQRLAAIHALAGFIAERCPEYLDWCAQLRAVRSKPSAPHQSAISRSRKSALYWRPTVRSQNSAVGIEHYCFFCTTREHGQKKLQNCASKISACTAARTVRCLRCVFTAKAAKFVSVRSGHPQP